MALTVDVAADLKPGHSYLYWYVLSILPYGAKAQYKGQIQPYRSVRGEPNFELLAPNDETAYAYLLATFGPGDARHLQSARLLEQARKPRLIDTNEPPPEGVVVVR
jgi:hypothetical protein